MNCGSPGLQGTPRKVTQCARARLLDIATTEGEMAVFNLTLQQTYFKQGFFNVTVDFDRYVRQTEGPVRLQLGRNGNVIQGKINRSVNNNGTARILGGVPLRHWFQTQFKPMETITVDLTSPDLIIIDK
jgi:hypothetical protein